MYHKNIHKFIYPRIYTHKRVYIHIDTHIRTPKYINTHGHKDIRVRMYTYTHT